MLPDNLKVARTALAQDIPERIGVGAEMRRKAERRGKSLVEFSHAVQMLAIEQNSHDQGTGTKLR